MIRLLLFNRLYTHKGISSKKYHKKFKGNKLYIKSSRILKYLMKNMIIGNYLNSNVNSLNQTDDTEQEEIKQEVKARTIDK